MTLDINFLISWLVRTIGPGWTIMAFLIVAGLLLAAAWIFIATRSR